MFYLIDFIWGKWTAVNSILYKASDIFYVKWCSTFSQQENLDVNKKMEETTHSGVCWYRNVINDSDEAWHEVDYISITAWP